MAGGGVIIAKNRDWLPDHLQELRLVKPADGYRYYGIYALGMGMKAGINEHGLVVVSASASSIPDGDREAMPYTRRLLARLLAESDSVDAALAKRDLFVGPQHLLLADRYKAAQVEIAPGGEVAVKTVVNGVLSHTNHYLEDSLVRFNSHIGASSNRRLGRIGQLLDSQPLFTLEDFITFSEDRVNGSDKSIWRTGRTPASTRTLASWIVVLLPHEAPQIYVKLANPGEQEQVYRLDAAAIFGKNH